MKIGYIRVSRDQQTTALQEDAMRVQQCERIFTDKMSGKRFDRPEFLRMLDLARSGDIIIVWRLDRLGRSLRELIEVVTNLNTRGIELRSLKEQIDTTTPTGKLMFHIMGAMAEFERDLISERTLAGLQSARERGHTGGRKPVTDKMKPADIVLAKQLYASGQVKIADIMKTTGFVNRSTFHKYIAAPAKRQQKSEQKSEQEATG